MNGRLRVQLMNYCLIKFLGGQSLEEVEQDYEKYCTKILENLKQEFSLYARNIKENSNYLLKKIQQRVAYSLEILSK